MATANTILSDINEIYTGYVLNGNKWYDVAARQQYDQRVKQAQPTEVADAEGKAVAMADEFVKWAKANGYKMPVRGVWWTARPNSMSQAVGYPVDQKKNPTDILIRFNGGPSDGFLGLSAKATQGSGDIGFKNPGLGTVDRSLGMSMSLEYKNQSDQTIKKYVLPEAASARKAYIRENPGIKRQTEEIGVKILAAMRDELLTRLKKFKQPELIKYLLSDWMDAEILKPPYIKVTGQGNKPPYKAVVMDPVKNEKLDALGKYPITLEVVGNESIGVKAGEKKIMKIRFKFESEKMASSVKLSGDPW
tara:strand:- start:1915 stop:2829 length:915 start_codon:yes stop_codon:yes gene_type:complete